MQELLTLRDNLEIFGHPTLLRPRTGALRSHLGPLRSRLWGRGPEGRAFFAAADFFEIRNLKSEIHTCLSSLAMPLCAPRPTASLRSSPLVIGYWLLAVFIPLRSMRSLAAVPPFAVSTLV